MNRRSFLHRSALASATLSALPLLGCSTETTKTPVAADAAVAPAPADFLLHEATLAQLAEHQRTGRYTARQLCELYQQRIEALNQQGP
jgi:amidase